LQSAVEQMAAGDLSAVTRLLASEKWSARFRIIPFSSVGREHGLLVGFKADGIRISVDGHKAPVGPCILGICRGPLDPDGVYSALIHPELVESAAAHRAAHAVRGRANETSTRSVSEERRPTGDVTRHSEV